MSKTPKFVIIGGIVVFFLVVLGAAFYFFYASSNVVSPDDPSFTQLPGEPVPGEGNEILPPIRVVDNSSPNVEVTPSINETPSQDTFFDPDDVIIEDQNTDYDAIAFLNEYKRSGGSSGNQGSDGSVNQGSNAQAAYDQFSKVTINTGNPEIDEFYAGWNPGMSYDEAFALFTSKDSPVTNPVDQEQIMKDVLDQAAPQLEDYSYVDCGNVDVVVLPSSNESEILSDIGNDQAALCFGKSFVSSCKPATVKFAGQMSIVTKTNDGNCAYGVAVNEYASVCGVSVNTSGTGSGLSDNQIAKIVFDLFAGNLTNSDCGMVRYK